jgi:hypothetical protein
MEIGLGIGGSRIGLQQTPMELRWVLHEKTRGGVCGDDNPL